MPGSHDGSVASVNNAVGRMLPVRSELLQPPLLIIITTKVKTTDRDQVTKVFMQQTFRHIVESAVFLDDIETRPFTVQSQCLRDVPWQPNDFVVLILSAFDRITLRYRARRFPIPNFHTEVET